MLDSYQYKVSLRDKDNKPIEIEVLGLEKISTSLCSQKIDHLVKLFNVEPELVEQAHGDQIHLLIGMQYAGFHPVCVASVGHLLLLQNRFGYLIAGSHPTVKETARKLVKHATIMHISGTLDRFFSIEGLGISCQPKCGSCQCDRCHPGGSDMSLQDELELKLIEENIEFNRDTGRWVAHYPWIKDPHMLPDKKCITVAILKSTEKRLLNNPKQAALYDKQIMDMVERGAARIVDDAELKEYKDCKYYICHHAVYKAQSKSTPCRIVFNSSLKFQGSSLNDFLAKGPSLLNQLLGVLLRFRENRVAFIGDIS